MDGTTQKRSARDGCMNPRFYSFSLKRFAATADKLKVSTSVWGLQGPYHTLPDTAVHQILGTGEFNLVETCGNSWSDLDRRWPCVDLKTAGNERTRA